MALIKNIGLIPVLAAVCMSLSGVSSAPAGNFLADLFGRSTSNGENFGSSESLGYAPTSPADNRPNIVEPKRPARAVVNATGSAFCVRTCDGKYFPAMETEKISRTASCKMLCPASDTKVFSGSSIETAVGRDGKDYAQLPNAYLYRKQLVSNCTCNGRSPGGMAAVKLEDDLTLRKGDLVSDGSNLRVATRDYYRKGGSIQFTTLNKSIKTMAAR